MIKEEHIVEKLVLPSTMESLSKVEKLIDEICEKHSISEDYYGNILIALTEGVNNCICHGNNLEEDKNVTVQVEYKDNSLTFWLSDEGLGFDYDNIPDPTLPENILKPSGRGIFLMQSLADETEFLNNGSTIKLKFDVID